MGPTHFIIRSLFTLPPMSHPNRYIWGTVYNKLLKDTPGTQVVNVSASRELTPQALQVLQNRWSTRTALTMEDRRIVYNDPAMRLTVGEIKAIAPGTPLRDNHTSRQVGVVVDSFVMDDQSTVKIIGEVTDPEAIKKYDAGGYRGLSVGYSRIKKGNSMEGLQFTEISLCPEPFFEGCNIDICASQEPGGTATIAGADKNQAKNTEYNRTLTLIIILFHASG